MIKKLTDYTVQLGGPIKKDRLFFFGSVQRYSVQDDPTGPRTLHTEVSPRFNGKLTWQPTSADNIFTTFQYDAVQPDGPASACRPPRSPRSSRRVNQDSPELIWNTQYRKVFGSSTFLETEAHRLRPGLLRLGSDRPAARRTLTRTAPTRAAAARTPQYDRTRNQVNAALSKYAEFQGQPQLEVRRRDRAQQDPQPVRRTRATRQSSTTTTAASRTWPIATATMCRGQSSATRSTRRISGGWDAPR